MIWRELGDVSGAKYGVRCGKQGEPAQWEMNFLGAGHYTYYEDRNGGLYDVDGNLVGDCDLLDSNVAYYCGVEWGRVEGNNLLNCRAPVTSDEITANKPK